MKIFALTGGIGSGKTTVAQIFSLLGIPVYNSDERAKYLMQHDEELKANIKKLFGEQSYLDNGTLNRDFLSAVAFSNIEMLSKLNKLVHPAVLHDFERWTKSHHSNSVIIETALVRDILPYIPISEIIVVTAEDDLRVRRASIRDHQDPEKIKSRDQFQSSSKDFINMADHLIWNNGDKSLIMQCLEVFLKISIHAS